LAAGGKITAVIIWGVGCGPLTCRAGPGGGGGGVSSWKEERAPWLGLTRRVSYYDWRRSCISLYGAALWGVQGMHGGVSVEKRDSRYRKERDPASSALVKDRTGLGCGRYRITKRRRTRKNEGFEH